MSDARDLRSEVRDPRSEVRDPDDRFDRAIDGAVREMLDVEPPADLRAKVVARIDAASTFRWKLLVPIAAAAMLILAVTLARRSEPPAQPVVVAHAGDRQPPVHGTPQSPIEVPGGPHRVATTATRTVARMRDGVAYAASSDATDAASGIDPLKMITPIEVTPIAHSSIAPEPIAVRPLSPITEMQIAPLNPPDGRD